MAIVCGINLSTNAAEALETAAMIAHRTGESLKLVHIIDELGAEVTLGGEHDALYDPLRRQMKGLADTVSARCKVDLECIIVPGIASQRLIEIAKEYDANLLIVAKTSHEQNGDWLSGSIAERVAQSSPIPVLVVKDNASLESWVQALVPLKVQVAVNLDQSSRVALNWAMALQTIAPCEIHVTHVVWPAEEKYRLGITDPLPPEGLLPEMEAKLMEEMRAWMGAAASNPSVALSLLPGMGRSDTQLVDYAKAKGIELLVVGARAQSKLGRLWRGSVSQNVLHDAACNVACISRATESVAETPIRRFNKVLIPTDFSELANSAIPVGYGMVAAGGTVHLLHVRNPHSTYTEESLYRKLRDLIPRDGEAGSIRTEIEVVNASEKSEVITLLAERLGVDAVCMATHARTGVSKMLLGSQAQDVLVHARCPVIMVPPASHHA